MSNVTEIVTEKLIKKLENGVRPWLAPWKAGLGFPKNFKTGKNYSGINILNLWSEAEEQGFKSSYWLTFNQIKELGGNIKKGSKSTPVLWASELKLYECPKCGEQTTRKTCPSCKNKKLNPTDQTTTSWRYYRAFNLDQTEGIQQEFQLEEREFQPIEIAEALLGQSQAKIIHSDQARAFYNSGQDKIQLPNKEIFKNEASYYATALHELTHWTGHKSRLNRDLKNRYGSAAYAFEELIAEMGSAFLCAELGIQSDLDNHASYLDFWVKILKEKPGALIEASSKASKAFQYLNNFTVIQERAA